MTPEEKAVIEQAVRWSRTETAGQAEDASEALQDLVANLLRSRASIGRPELIEDRLGYPSSVGDANWRAKRADSLPGESEPSCGQHEEPDTSANWRTIHNDVEKEWVPATLVQCLAGDHIRIGTDETDVIRTDGGRVWHADNTNPYQPKPWKHVELRMELAANPGFQEYPPNTPCEILADPERAASLLVQSAFPGSAVTSSDVD